MPPYNSFSQPAPPQNPLQPPPNYNNQYQQQPYSPPSPPPPQTLHQPMTTSSSPVQSPPPFNDIAAPKPYGFTQTAPPPTASNPSPFQRPTPVDTSGQLAPAAPVKLPVPTTQVPGGSPFSPPQSPPANPFSPPAAQVPINRDPDNGMDDILKDVNRSVAKTDVKGKKSKLSPVLTKLPQLKNHTSKAVTQPQPALVITLAAVAFLSLASAAFFAFKDDSGTKASLPDVRVVGTTAVAGDSIQANGGTLVSPQELEDLGQTLKKQIGDFNESQDFNQDPLTDQALGL